MPLPIAGSQNLGIRIPGGQFNEHGLAVLTISGGRYDGDWSIAAVCGDDTLGEFRTSVDDRRKQELLNDPGYPDRAAETAFIWLMGETKRQGLRVVGFECLNSRYAPAERPYFCLAQAVVADSSFEPAAGVIYADEMTLDAVMRITDTEEAGQ